MYDLTGFQRDLLIVVAGLDRPYGLAIKEWLEAEYGTDVNHGRLYPNLDALVEDGFVEQGTIDKRTNRYALTEKGRELLLFRKRRLEDVL